MVDSDLPICSDGMKMRSWQLPSAAGCGVSTPAARAECGAASGAAEFGDVPGAAERGLVWIGRILEDDTILPL